MEEGSDKMGELTYKELIEKINFPCVIILDCPGRNERKELLDKEDKKKIEKYREKSKEGELSFVLVSLPSGDIFGILRGKYISPYSIFEIKIRTRNASINNIVQKTEPPYLIFNKLKERVNLKEINVKDRKKFEKYIKKSERNKEIFYIFPERSIYSYFYKVKKGKIKEKVSPYMFVDIEPS